MLLGLESFIEGLGLRVLSATDGEQAVEVFRRHADEVDLVLLDRSMPKMNGDEVLRQIRRLRTTVPVVISSAYDESEAPTTSQAETRADAFLQKPYRLEVLGETIRSLLATSESEDPAARKG